MKDLGFHESEANAPQMPGLVPLLWLTGSIQSSSVLTMNEKLRIQPVTVPAADYDACKKFFDGFLGADGQQAVLVRN